MTEHLSLSRHSVLWGICSEISLCSKA